MSIGIGEMIRQLRGCTNDWNGKPMPDDGEPRYLLTCGMVRNAADLLERLSIDHQEGERLYTRAEVEGLVDALRPFLAEMERLGLSGNCPDNEQVTTFIRINAGLLRRANKALSAFSETAKLEK